MIVLQLIAMVLLIIIFNITGRFTFMVLKKIFFWAYIKEKEREQNPHFHNINWIDKIVISIAVLIVIYYWLDSLNEFPNDEILFPLVIVCQIFVIYRIFKLKKEGNW